MVIGGRFGDCKKGKAGGAAEGGGNLRVPGKKLYPYS